MTGGPRFQVFRDNLEKIFPKLRSVLNNWLSWSYLFDHAGSFGTRFTAEEVAYLGLGTEKCSQASQHKQNGGLIKALHFWQLIY